MAHLHHARAGDRRRRVEVALVAYGSAQRSVGRGGASVQEIDPGEAPYRPLKPVTAYALAAAATCTSSARRASSSPRWRSRRAGGRSATRAPGRARPLTIDDVLAAPMVCDPLGVRDCCLVTDGGAAIVVTTRSARARSRTAGLCSAPARPQPSPHQPHARPHDDRARSSPARARSRWRAWRRPTGRLQLYDAFTITPILFLEDLGFCAKGEGGAFVAGGRSLRAASCRSTPTAAAQLPPPRACTACWRSSRRRASCAASRPARSRTATSRSPTATAACWHPVHPCCWGMRARL